MALLSQRELATLVAYYQGQRRVYIPKQPDQAHPLVQLLGEQSATSLSQKLGGEYLELPTLRPPGRRRSNPLRDYLIRQQYRNGATVAQLAQTYEISPRALRRLLSKSLYMSP